MAITPLPTLDRTSATFRTDVDTFFGSQLPAFAAEANALQADVNAKQVTASAAADTATTKAGEALTSAGNAATSKTDADTARDAALAAQAAAELALDSFDDRYLGAKAVAPTLDNDGNALLPGALYWDTVLPGMRAWTGAAWSTLPAATAAATANTPAGNISSTTVQAAINELDTEKVSLTGDQTIAGTKTFSSTIAGSVSGNAGTVTNGVYTTGDQTIAGTKTFSSTIAGSVSGNAGTVTNGVYTTGDQTIAGTKTFSSTIAGSITGNAATASGVLFKADHTTVAFTKTGAGTAEVKAGTLVEVDGTTVTFTAATAITMPALTAGTDYAIYACTDGTIRADASFSAPSGYTTANSRKIGGFHYAPGGHSGAPGGGNTTPGIWAGSFWDMKWRPNCPDPRGMEYWCGSWMDMYLTGVDAITLGSSRYNVTMADGSSPPKVPTIFGGNGSTTYGSYTWFEASELAMAMGKRLPTQREFMAHAYGATEASSIGTDQNSTILNAAYTSAAGLFQATGVLWVWGDDRGGAYNTAGWNANTEGRGSEYNAPNAVLLGGGWGNGANCGSRCSYWSYVASFSTNDLGSRFSADHLQMD